MNENFHSQSLYVKVVYALYNYNILTSREANTCPLCGRVPVRMWTVFIVISCAAADSVRSIRWLTRQVACGLTAFTFNYYVKALILKLYFLFKLHIFLSLLASRIESETVSKGTLLHHYLNELILVVGILINFGLTLTIKQ